MYVSHLIISESLCFTNISFFNPLATRLASDYIRRNVSIELFPVCRLIPIQTGSNATLRRRSCAGFNRARGSSVCVHAGYEAARDKPASSCLISRRAGDCLKQAFAKRWSLSCTFLMLSPNRTPLAREMSDFRLVFHLFYI